MSRIHILKIRIHVLCSLLITLVGLPFSLHAAETSPAKPILEAVKSTGTLVCGIIREEEDYSRAQPHGNRAAFDFDICKGISAAINGKNAKTIFVPFPDEPSAIQGLRQGKVQLLATATPSFVNTNLLGVSFSPVLMHDGQGFLVRKNSGITSPRDLAGKKVCFIGGTSLFENLTAYSAKENVKVFPFPFEEDGEMEAAMFTGNCAAMTSDVTRLANTRARYSKHAGDFEILPQTITDDPLAVAYLPGDLEWAAAVDATVSAIIQAEQSGVTAANVEQMRDETTDPAIPVYFGRKNGTATVLHLDADWAVREIESIGNYGEVFERDLGSKSPLLIHRGLSNLWNNGGLLYAPPIGNK
jgi:general L-amino acid transport system substrate-binding protein